MEWLFWIGGALLLVVVETVTADLTFLMIAGGALGGGLTGFFGGPLWAQVVVFACISTLLLFAVRPWAKRRLAATTPQMKTNVDALIGRSATTITAVDGGGGPRGREPSGGRSPRQRHSDRRGSGPRLPGCARRLLRVLIPGSVREVRGGFDPAGGALGC